MLARSAGQGEREDFFGAGRRKAPAQVGGQTSSGAAGPQLRPRMPLSNRGTMRSISALSSVKAQPVREHGREFVPVSALKEPQGAGIITIKRAFVLSLLAFITLVSSSAHKVVSSNHQQ